jgi:S1-C subfamily serine protease
MKRTLLSVSAVAVLALASCTQGGASATPASVSSPSATSGRSGNAQTLELAPAIRGGSYDPTKDPIVRLVQQVRPAVVNVTTDLVEQSQFGGTQPGQGTGTGFIIRADGIVVTNYHVVEQAQRITVITPETGSSGGQSYSARVIGGDQAADLAVLKVQASGLPTVPLGDSGDLLLGERVVAIGYALALKGGPTVSSGIVSALGRVINAQDPNCDPAACGENQTRKYGNVIQTDAAINPGNSGGPMLDLNGNVVGINTAGSGNAENIGFAIPINAARGTIEHAVEDPGAAVAYLGVVTETVTPELAAQFGLPADEGVYVVNVSPGGPAEEAGVKGGDVIVSFDGTAVTGSEQLGKLIQSHRPGDDVTVEVVGPDGSRTLDVTLGVNPLP